MEALCDQRPYSSELVDWRCLSHREAAATLNRRLQRILNASVLPHRWVLFRDKRRAADYTGEHELMAF